MASSEPPRTYDVFLSFRGTDTRNNFLGHLYKALEQRGIHTYIDSEELRKGDRISRALMEAVEKSRIAIVVFSEKYADSRWCLEELAKIMECKEHNELIVLPVFYKVEPREVRGNERGYGRALAEHECKFGKDSKPLEKWKNALVNAADLSGWHLNDGHEAELIEIIIKEISIQLNRVPLHVAEYPIGIDSRVEELKPMLGTEFEDDVRMIGLWGPGGIGKTSMAKAVYNTIFQQFEGSSFLAHVREKADDLVPLQAQLLFEILSGKTLTIFSDDGGIELIKEKLRWKKVLVVLDDVDKLDQLKRLAGACDWFGKGSRIIVTTRDKHLLISHGIDHIYEVKPLSNEEAYELFCLHCFKGKQSIEISEDIIQIALHYANGFPIAIEVLGSFLCGRNELQWRSALTELANSPDQTINRVLKMSFDLLKHNEREIFLDIACFFKGCNIEYVKKVLDSCGFSSTIGLEVLIERALISLQKQTLEMHHLIQSMGRDIVNQECPDDPSKRSRLWLYDDVLDIFSSNTGSDTVKAIRLALPRLEEIPISPDAFTNVKKLRLLIMFNAKVSFTAPICLPNELRWLEWPEFSAPTLKFSSGRKKLVGLDISKSHIGEPIVNFQQFENLKFINFSYCKWLVCMPDLFCTPNLVDLNLSGCENLMEVHQSIIFLSKLRDLSLSGCSKVEQFPEIPKQMDCLQSLNLSNTSIKELPASIENITSLRFLTLSACRNLTTLPSSVYNLQSLRGLFLTGCSNFVEFPRQMDDSTDSRGSLGLRELEYFSLEDCKLSEVEFLDNLSCFPSLEVLRLSGNDINSLPSSIGKRKHLWCLEVNRCEKLQEIPELSSTGTLDACNCKSLRKIPILSGHGRGHLKVDLSSCPLLAREGSNVFDILPLKEIHSTQGADILLSGDEIACSLLPGEEVSFIVPQELYDNFVGFAICAVLNFHHHAMWDRGPCRASIFINGRTLPCLGIPFGPPFDSTKIWLRYLPRQGRPIWNVNDYLRNDWSHFSARIEPRNAIMVKKWGFRLVFKRQEDDLKVVPWQELLAEIRSATRRYNPKQAEGSNRSDIDLEELPEQCSQINKEKNGETNLKEKHQHTRNSTHAKEGRARLKVTHRSVVLPLKRLLSPVFFQNRARKIRRKI